LASSSRRPQPKQRQEVLGDISNTVEDNNRKHVPTFNIDGFEVLPAASAFLPAPNSELPKEDGYEVVLAPNSQNDYLPYDPVAPHGLPTNLHSPYRFSNQSKPIGKPATTLQSS
jgi:hypothetical protein